MMAIHRESNADGQRDQGTHALLEACREVFAQRSDPRIIAAIAYGSRLRQRSHPDSDFDIAILDDDESPLSFSEQARLMDELERRTGLPIDLRMIRNGDLSYQKHVAERGTVIWSVEDKRLDEWRGRVRREWNQTASLRRVRCRSILAALAGQGHS